MTEAPENIFLLPKDAALFGRKYGHPDVQQVYVGDESVQYVRKDVADLARPVTVAEAAKVRCQSVVDYYEQCVCDAKTDSQRNIAEFQFNAANSVLLALSHEGGE